MTVPTCANTDTVNYSASVTLNTVSGPLSTVEIVNANSGSYILTAASSYLFTSATAVQAGGDTGTTYNNFETIQGTTGDDSFDLALSMQFDSVADMHAYVIHPQHQEFLKLAKPHVAKLMVYDFR